MFKWFRDKIKLFEYYKFLYNQNLKDPEPGTFCYFMSISIFFFKIRLYLLLFGVIFILFIFWIWRLINKYESLVVFIYIVWFCFSLFYIEFIRV